MGLTRRHRRKEGGCSAVHQPRPRPWLTHPALTDSPGAEGGLLRSFLTCRRLKGPRFLARRLNLDGVFVLVRTLYLRKPVITPQALSSHTLSPAIATLKSKLLEQNWWGSHQSPPQKGRSHGTLFRSYRTQSVWTLLSQNEIDPCINAVIPRCGKERTLSLHFIPLTLRTCNETEFLTSGNKTGFQLDY